MENKNSLGYYLFISSMKQTTLAEKAGLHVCQVNAAVRSNIASPRIRAKIADALCLPEEKLFPYGTRSY